MVVSGLLSQVQGPGECAWDQGTCDFTSTAGLEPVPDTQRVDHTDLLHTPHFLLLGAIPGTGLFLSHQDSRTPF